MYKLNLPEIDSKNMSTKDKIVMILSHTWPLNTKKIYNTLKKKAPSVTLTYQAVHKSIKELLEANVIVKEDEGYRINAKWIDSLKKFVDEVKDEYKGIGMSAEKMIKELETKESITLKFGTVEEAYDWWVEIEETVFANEGYNMCKHDAYPFVLRHMLHKKQDAGRIKLWYQVLGGSGKVDAWCSEQYNKSGSHSTYGIKEAENYWALLIIGDYVIHDFIDETIKKQIFELFEKIEDPADFDAKKFYELIRKPTTYIAQITKNHEIAEMYKKKILSYLKKARKIN